MTYRVIYVIIHRLVSGQSESSLITIKPISLLCYDMELTGYKSRAGIYIFRDPCHNRASVLSTDQSIILEVIKENARTATKPIDRITIRRLLNSSRSDVTDGSLTATLKKLVKEGYLRVGISFKTTYILVKWG